MRGAVNAKKRQSRPKVAKGELYRPDWTFSFVHPTREVICLPSAQPFLRFLA